MNINSFHIRRNLKGLVAFHKKKYKSGTYLEDEVHYILVKFYNFFHDITLIQNSKIWTNSLQKYGTYLLKETWFQSPLLLHIISLDSFLPGENNCITLKYSDILSFVSSWEWASIHLVWWEVSWEGCIYINIPLPFHSITLGFFPFLRQRALRLQKW